MSNTLRSKSRPLSDEVLSPNKKSKRPIVTFIYVWGQIYVALVPKWGTMQEKIDICFDIFIDIVMCFIFIIFVGALETA